MRKYVNISLIVLMLLIGCNSANYTIVKQVKPVNRNRFYKPGKDKKKKRVKIVRVKILKKSKAVNPPKDKPPKKKKVTKQDSTQQEIVIPEEKTNEPDSTGQF